MYEPILYSLVSFRPLVSCILASFDFNKGDNNMENKTQILYNDTIDDCWTGSLRMPINCTL